MNKYQARDVKHERRNKAHERLDVRESRGPKHRTYITFGQIHRHVISGVVFDRDCVAEIACDDANHGRELAHEYFGDQFCFDYYEDAFKPDMMVYYPGGFVKVN